MPGEVEDAAAQCAVWTLWLTRRRWEQAQDRALTVGDAVAVAAAEAELLALPEVSAVQALAANARAIALLGSQRWTAMQAAREQGVSLEQIGRALGISRQAAWEALQRRRGACGPAGPAGPHPARPDAAGCGPDGRDADGRPALSGGRR